MHIFLNCANAHELVLNICVLFLKRYKRVQISSSYGLVPLLEVLPFINELTNVFFGLASKRQWSLDDSCPTILWLYLQTLSSVMLFTNLIWGSFACAQAHRLLINLPMLCKVMPLIEARDRFDWILLQTGQFCNIYPCILLFFALTDRLSSTGYSGVYLKTYSR